MHCSKGFNRLYDIRNSISNVDIHLKKSPNVTFMSDKNPTIKKLIYPSRIKTLKNNQGSINEF